MVLCSVAFKDGATKAAIGLLVAGVWAGSAASATAQAKQATGLYNARYCEVFEVKGALPDIVVSVYNTIKLNKCPAALWNSLDAKQLAEENGDLAVILNGPRHFLMDSVIAQPGPVKAFDGLRTHMAATIDIHSAAELVQTSYTERTINRSNTWRWNAGRRIYELVSPEGVRYVMQSYAQIKDPSLKIGQLPSLGSRLALPAGWRYTTRKLKRDLVLKAKGSATVIQDDLLDTYQREP
jgi:hypothetical protein